MFHDCAVETFGERCNEITYTLAIVGIVKDDSVIFMIHVVIFYVNDIVTQKKIYRDVSMMWFTAEQLRVCVDGQRLSDMREPDDRDRGPV